MGIIPDKTASKALDKMDKISPRITALAFSTVSAAPATIVGYSLFNGGFSNTGSPLAVPMAAAFTLGASIVSLACLIGAIKGPSSNETLENLAP